MERGKANYFSGVVVDLLIMRGLNSVSIFNVVKFYQYCLKRRSSTV